MNRLFHRQSIQRKTSHAKKTFSFHGMSPAQHNRNRFPLTIRYCQQLSVKAFIRLCVCNKQQGMGMSGGGNTFSDERKPAGCQWTRLGKVHLARVASPLLEPVNDIVYQRSVGSVPFPRHVESNLGGVSLTGRTDRRRTRVFAFNGRVAGCHSSGTRTWSLLTNESLYDDGWAVRHSNIHTTIWCKKAFCVLSWFAQVRMNDDGWTLLCENLMNEIAVGISWEKKNPYWPLRAIFVESLPLSSLFNVWRLPLRTAAQTVDKGIKLLREIWIYQAVLIDIENRIGSIMDVVIYHFFA